MVIYLCQLNFLEAVNIQSHEWHVVPGQLLHSGFVKVLLDTENVQGLASGVYLFLQVTLINFNVQDDMTSQTKRGPGTLV